MSFEDDINWHSNFSKKLVYLLQGRSLKIMKNAFYFMLQALFVLKISTFCHEFLGLVGKWLDKKAKVNFKTYDVLHWETKNYSSHIAQYLKK